MQTHLTKRGRNLAPITSDIYWSFDYFYWWPFHLLGIMVRLHNLYKQCWSWHLFIWGFYPFDPKQKALYSENTHKHLDTKFVKNFQGFTDFPYHHLSWTNSCFYTTGYTFRLLKISSDLYFYKMYLAKC